MLSRAINYRQERRLRDGFSEPMAWGLAAFEALRRGKVTEAEWRAWALSPDGSDEFDAKVARFAPAVVA